MFSFSKQSFRSDRGRHGMILFLTVLILGVTASAVILLLTQNSVNGFLSIDEKIKSEQVRGEVLGCLDEVLVHYAGNASYVPSAINLAIYTCNATVQTNGNQRTVTVTRTNQGITRRVVAVINLGVTPITVSSVLEQ